MERERHDENGLPPRFASVDKLIDRQTTELIGPGSVDRVATAPYPTSSDSSAVAVYGSPPDRPRRSMTGRHSRG